MHRFILLLVTLTGLQTTSLVCSDEWTMEQVGDKDLGLIWHTPIHVGPDRWMMASNNGVIVVVTDSGKTLTRLDVGICSDLVCLANVGTAVVIGAADGTLLYTTDQGSTLKSIGVVPGGITAMQALDSNEFAVSTRSGTVSIVNKEAGTVTVVYADSTQQFNGMDVHQGELSVIGFRGTIIHTTNRGESWTTTFHDSTIDFTTCCRIDDSTLVLGATYARVYVTEDNGRAIVNSYQAKTYSKQMNPVEWVTSITHWKDTIFFTGHFFPRTPERYFNVYRSTDRGSTWEGFEYPEDAIYHSVVAWPPWCMYWDEGGIGRLVLANQQYGVLHLCSSSDMGEHWVSDSVMIGRAGEVVEYSGETMLGSLSYFAADTSHGKLYILAKESFEPSGLLPQLTKLYESPNEGKDLFLLGTFSSNVNSISIQDSVIVLGCDSGSVLMSYDLGRTFSERIVVDSAIIYNGVSTIGHTPGGLFVLFDEFPRSGDGVDHRGWVATMDRAQNVRQLPYARPFINDIVTAPYVYGNKVLFVLHEVDTARLVIASYIVTWDTETDQVTTEDVTEILRDWISYEAAVKYVDDKHIWIATSTQVLVYDRATKQAQRIPEFQRNKMLFGNGPAEGMAVSDGTNFIYLNGALYATTTPPTGWTKAVPCGSTERIGISISRVVGLGNGRFFVVGSPFNRILIAPSPTSVFEEVSIQRAASDAVAVRMGMPVLVEAPDATRVYCIDLMGRSSILSTSHVESGIHVNTATLFAGMYVIVAESSSGLITRSVLVMP